MVRKIPSFLQTISIILIIVTLCDNVKNSMLKFSSLTCTSLNETFCIFKTCRLKAIKRDVTEVSIYAKMLQLPITDVGVSLLLKHRNDFLNRSLYEYTIDGCAFLRNKRRNPLANMFYNFLGLKTHSNANHSCPYNHDIILNRYSINNNMAAMVPLPIGSYLVYTRWKTGGVVRADVKWVLEVTDR